MPEALETLESVSGELPGWLRSVCEVEAVGAKEAGEAAEGMAAEVGKETSRLLGDESLGGGAGGGRAARAYLAGMRNFHAKCGRRFEAALKSYPGYEEEKETPVSPGRSNTLASSGTLPPPIPHRKTQTHLEKPSLEKSGEKSSGGEKSGGEEDPFSEQPVEPAALRTRVKSSVAAPPLAKPTLPPPPTQAPSPPASPRRTAEETSSMLASTPPPPASPAAVKGGATVGRRGMGSRGLGAGRSRAAVMSQEVGGSSKAAEPLEWGSVERPLRALCEAGDLELETETSFKFEVQRKAGLLLAANFSITVSRGGAEPSISIYDVKQQTSVQRPLSQVLKVTRSNKNPRKLKIHWRAGGADAPAAGCDRFLFASQLQREQFVECMWQFRKTVPQPLLYAEPIEIFIGTWNLGDAKPDDAIDAWLHPHVYDIYCVSAQEAGYDLEKGQGNAEQHFFSLIQASLGPEYVLVAQLSLLHIRHAVYVAKRHAHKISNVRKASVATGIGNVIGNKGGCFVSMSFNETSLCFIGCHLAAREERYEQRCQNVEQILQGINAEQPPGLAPDTWFDYVFWTGDMNFRLVADRSEVCKWAKECNVEKLLQTDQFGACPARVQGVLHVDGASDQVFSPRIASTGDRWRV